MPPTTGRCPSLTAAVGWRGASVSLVAGTILAALACPDVAVADQAAASFETAREGSRGTSWDVGVSVSAYLFTNQVDFLQPTVAVDHGALHLEGRYNYEALRTGSLWIGWNFEWGESPKIALTPLLVGVLGDVHGIAPGFEANLSWGPVEFYWEGEYIFDVTQWPVFLFLTQSELSARPLEWLRLGGAAQRNRALSKARQVQWGPLVAVNVWKVYASVYWLNPGQANIQYWVASLGADF
ncbi:MAG TPA: hypothetical protein VFR85_00625 [Anaeromyxobacteraceae bacterium]|nr:hypothetical protein [Anaeromyxobacteraceae bacterium]